MAPNEIERISGTVRKAFSQAKGYAVYVTRDDGKPEERRFTAFGTCPYKEGDRIEFNVAEKPGKDGTVFYNMVGLIWLPKKFDLDQPMGPGPVRPADPAPAGQAVLAPPRNLPVADANKQIARCVAWKAVSGLMCGTGDFFKAREMQRQIEYDILEMA